MESSAQAPDSSKTNQSAANDKQCQAMLLTFPRHSMQPARAILVHAAAVHGIEVSVESVQLARAALKHLDLVGKSNERDRRPTQDELNRLVEYAESNSTVHTAWENHSLRSSNCHASKCRRQRSPP